MDKRIKMLRAFEALEGEEYGKGLRDVLSDAINRQGLLQVLQAVRDAARDEVVLRGHLDCDPELVVEFTDLVEAWER